VSFAAFTEPRNAGEKHASLATTRGEDRARTFREALQGPVRRGQVAVERVRQRGVGRARDERGGRGGRDRGAAQAVRDGDALGLIGRAIGARRARA
jgi:hypothetical protein